MNSIVLKHSRGSDGVDNARLVHRAHDLSGTSYQGIASIDFDLALTMGRNGVVLRAADAPRFSGHPGAVFLPAADACSVILDIRTDVADPATSINRIRTESDLENYVLQNIDVDRLKWVRGEPQVDHPAPRKAA